MTDTASEGDAARRLNPVLRQVRAGNGFEGSGILVFLVVNSRVWCGPVFYPPDSPCPESRP